VIPRQRLLEPGDARCTAVARGSENMPNCDRLGRVRVLWVTAG